MDDAGGFSCEVTAFSGFEQQILRLRNANRERVETLEYLRWRYQFPAGAPEPRIFWLLDPAGERVGMAAVIFRAYRLNGDRVSAAVVGDISLDSRWRGRGLGRLLLRYMTDYLDAHFPTHPAFVIPTESARRSLARAGWTTCGKLVPYVCVLDARRYLGALVRSKWVAQLIAACLQRGARLLARLRVPRDGALFVSEALDQALLEFANSLRGHGAEHDLGADALRWRYAQHPHTRFAFGKYYSSGEIRGFVVLEDDELNRVCSIYDLAAKTAVDAQRMLALLLSRGLSSELNSVRMVVNDRHPLKGCLRGLGFIPRPADSVFQVHSLSGAAERFAWCVTHGAKDT